MSDFLKTQAKIFKTGLPWVIPILFIVASLLLLSKGDASILSAIFLIVSGMIFSPLVKKSLAEYLNKYVSFFVRICLFALFIAVALNAGDIKPPPSKFTSPKHEELYYTLLLNDFENSLIGGQTIISSKDWLKVLGVEGIVDANILLDDFEKNEVKAVQKYSGAWLINGRIQSIDNSFGTAIVSLGGASKFSAFNANFKDKTRAASYNVGDKIQTYCKSITEVATMINGHRCSDYRDWKKEALRKALNSHSDISLTSSNIKNFDEAQDFTRKRINQLSENSVCFKDIHDQQCSKDMEGR